jgi:RNA polymerase sigma factor (sigma-70 family)
MFQQPSVQQPSDCELLGQFLASGSEEAFARIVQRYGSLVYGVCRRYVSNDADADDAWQATFFVLARNAATIRKSQALASWLHGTARRVASFARRQAHRLREQPLTESEIGPSRVLPADILMEARETASLLEHELAKLPERYRAPLILSCLQGLPKSVISQRLGWPSITVTGRLARGKALLRSRLTRRGLAPAVIAGALSGSSLLHAWPTALFTYVLSVAVQLRAGGTVGISPVPLAFMKGVILMSLVKKLSLAASLLIVLSGAALGLFWSLPTSQADDQYPQQAKSQNTYSDPELQRDYETLQGRWLERCSFGLNYTNPSLATTDAWLVFSGNRQGFQGRYKQEVWRNTFKLEKSAQGKILTTQSGDKVVDRVLYSIQGDILIKTYRSGDWEQLAKRVGEAGDPKVFTSIYQRVTDADIRARDKGEGGPNKKYVANQLLEIIRAFHNYHADWNILPQPALFDKTTSQPLLSWRVMLLPYLREGGLYREFHLNEPWDSAHNKPLLVKMPKIFTHPEVDSDPKAGLTHYQLFVGAAVHQPAKTYQFAPAFSWDPKFKLTLRELTFADGTSSTILLAEARKAVPWTKPEDLLIKDDQSPLPELGALPQGDDFLAAWGDGSVRNLYRSLPEKDKGEKLLRQMTGYHDGWNFDVSPIMK